MSENQIMPDDLSHDFLQNMYQTIKNDDLENYKKLFNEYINNDKYENYFYYNEQGPAYYHHFSKYPFCTCIDENNVKNSMFKIHKHNSIIKCCCKNGKYYLALIDAYQFYTDMHPLMRDIIIEIITITDEEENYDKFCEQYKKILLIKNNKVKIISWLLSLKDHNEYKLFIEWKSCHVGSDKHEYCTLCTDRLLYLKKNSHVAKNNTIILK